MQEHKVTDAVYSQRIKAGRRVYFFDVKSTRSNDYYLTITESRRQQQEDGFHYEKQRLFLYKEDLNKFLKAMNETAAHIKQKLMPDYDFSQFDNSDRKDELAD